MNTISPLGIFSWKVDLIMKQELEQLLAQDDTFMVEGVLNKNKLAEFARQYNPELLNILMSNDKISKYFFSTLDTGVLVFKKDVFLQFLNNKEFLPDSFTAYKTKIGLATGDKYLSENQEVVLNFPYKDCVLEGGQTKDDAKRQEIFFNETLAPTEINRLLDDKVLTNFKRYDETGEHEVEVLNDTDNLIIKGNNLIALHSLKKRFAGKVKLIYIDIKTMQWIQLQTTRKGDNTGVLELVAWEAFLFYSEFHHGDIVIISKGGNFITPLGLAITPYDTPKQPMRYNMICLRLRKLFNLWWILLFLIWYNGSIHFENWHQWSWREICR